ncbi:hypothetical protein B0T21DRAFT_350958 [Apiosordaria backusii]|uniref:Uncharacterized protein n=1 Tax=Apiosordaria backusii TaxID=314023 RepID=A0AA40AXH9_9PEZI|nr:hypothetical protein B0T21DRAFT_350958 [Apiosordaria backusii]
MNQWIKGRPGISRVRTTGAHRFQQRGELCDSGRESWVSGKKIGRLSRFSFQVVVGEQTGSDVTLFLKPPNHTEKKCDGDLVTEKGEKGEKGEAPTTLSFPATPSKPGEGLSVGANMAPFGVDVVERSLAFPRGLTSRRISGTAHTLSMRNRRSLQLSS